MKLAIAAAMLLSTAVYAGEYSDNNNVTMAPTVHPTKPCFDSLTWEGPGEVELECLPMERPGDPGISVYAYVPDTSNCMAVVSSNVTFSQPTILNMAVPTLSANIVDTSCMKLQAMNAGLKYCSMFPKECYPQIEMIGKEPFNIPVPNEQSGFWDVAGAENYEGYKRLDKYTHPAKRVIQSEEHAGYHPNR